MKISLVTVGKTETKALQDSVLEYTKRIQRYATFDFVEATEEKLEKTLEKFDRVYLLDEKAKEYTSVEFAGFVEKQLNMGLKSIAFAVGGPFGFSDKVRKLAFGEIALSKMTFPHDLVRVIFLEQLYRAFSILKNEKYHHE
jgi:23S rRNA (pseudouridine1915-N3)-methyltransferase